MAEQFVKIEESYAYLGVLRNQPLMEAMQAFENISDKIIKLSEKIWEKQKYPPLEKLFVQLGEDYEKIEHLIHANDALEPIYDGLRQVYEYLEQLRDAGVSLEEGKEKLKTIIENRKHY